MESEKSPLTTQSAVTKPDYRYHARRWESSGLNQKAYCRKHQLSYSQLVAARVELRQARGETRQPTKPSFLPVSAPQPVSLAAPVQAAVITLHLAQGHRVELPANLEPNTLLTLLASLGAAS